MHFIVFTESLICSIQVLVEVVQPYVAYADDAVKIMNIILLYRVSFMI